MSDAGYVLFGEDPAPGDTDENYLDIQGGPADAGGEDEIVRSETAASGRHKSRTGTMERLLMVPLEGKTASSARTLNSFQDKKKLSWQAMAVIMTAELIGMGVLSLPKSFQYLGWVPSLILMPLVALLTSVSAIQMWEIHMKAQGTVTSYPALFSSMFGPRARAYSSAVVYLLVFLVCASAILASADSWHAVARETCVQGWFALAAVLAFCLGQNRSLKGLSVLSGVSFALIIVPMVIALSEVYHQSRHDPLYLSEPTEVAGKTFRNGVIAATNILFAFSGHVLFFEFMSEMEEPADFPKAFYVSQIVGFVFYSFVGGFVYAYAGTADWLVAPVNASLRHSAAKVVVEIMVVAHVTVTAVIYGTFVVQVVQNVGEPVVVRMLNLKPSAEGSKREGMLWWALWTALVYFAAMLVAMVIPYFDYILAIIASIVATQTTIMWPGVALLQRHGPTLTTAYRLLSYILLLIGAFLMIIGSWASISAIAEAYKSGEGTVPFSCSALSVDNNGVAN